jgi:hypothetical protein
LWDAQQGGDGQRRQHDTQGQLDMHHVSGPVGRSEPEHCWYSRHLRVSLNDRTQAGY